MATGYLSRVQAQMFWFSRRRPQPPAEYLYIDHGRLDDYVEQSLGDLKQNRTADWRMEMSISGPKIYASRESSPASYHRKAEALLQFLSANRYVADRPGGSRIADTEVETAPHLPFVFTSLLAVKMILPDGDDGERALWIHTNMDSHLSGDTVNLCLLEDCRLRDGHVKTNWSAYSALLGMVSACGDELARTPLAEYFKNAVVPIERPRWGEPEMEYYMPYNPIDLVSSVGGKVVGRPRQIEVLYRVRDSFSSTGWGTHEFGYPIFVREGRGV